MNTLTLIQDSREKSFLPISPDIKTEIKGLQSGDISIKGLEHLFSIEMKHNLADLVGSLTSGRERFERELHRLRGFHFKRLLIIGTEEEIKQHRYRSKASPQSILGSLNAFQVRYDVPYVFAGTESNAARLVETWAHYFHREYMRLLDQP